MKVEGTNTNYNQSMQLEKNSEITKECQDYTDQETTHDDTQPLSSGSCSINDIYESMGLNSTNKAITTIEIYNTDYNTSFWLSDDGSLTCIEDCGDKKNPVLWKISLNEDEFFKIEELLKSAKNFVLREKEIVEAYLKGTISIEDMESLQLKE